ncbi:RNA polymerase sigma factor [Ktedonospora formicarum]|uniref:RNA polymerase sigma factor n=1 Tax=Ktedonospora formicarum TaxID=2778364 RepID=A0A8J3I691_9CHLR|nr:sigma-70 family RNA polymerase sigma factor [Ktedonospora formicarum]GHO46852.1 RNA polymerase sigma factor [Ktedonospora formicarum]
MQRLEPNHEPAIALYEAYAPTVFAYLLRQLRTREDAEDILLEVFTVVVEKGASIRGEGKHYERAWIMAIARNKVVDYFRRHGKHYHVPIAAIEDTVLAAEERQPEQTILQQEEYAQLRMHVLKLPTSQQEILQLRFGEGLRCGEIAQVTAKSEGAVRTMLYRALNLLRRIYEQAEGDL